MAEEKDGKKVKKAKGYPLLPGWRAFARPRISLFRLGREVAKFKGDLAVVHSDNGHLLVIGNCAETTVANAVLKSEHVLLNIGVDRWNAVCRDHRYTYGYKKSPDNNRIMAVGRVSLEEGGVSVNSDRLVATPALTGLVMGGHVHLKSESREAAEELMKSHRG